MTRYVLRRLGHALVVLWGAVTLSFLVVQLIPGDPARIMLGGGASGGEGAGAADDGQVAALRTELGLDRPVLAQYAAYLVRVVTLDWGTSFAKRQPVTDVIASGLESTLQLGAASIALTVVLGMLFGLGGVLLPGRWVRSAFQSITVLGIAVPSFWLAILLLQVFSFGLGWFPAFGAGSPAALVLPALTLALLSAGTLGQLLTRGIEDGLREPYADTARARGLSRAGVVLRHVLRNASLPVFTMVGMLIGSILSGATIVETIYGRPGVGNLFVVAVQARDFPLIQALVVLTGGVFVLVTLVVDIAYRWIDPRVVEPDRREGARRPRERAGAAA
ncbi:ABC transporter permease [Agrococcus terreus]|uniref:Peptide ABC transporter permease n=1 Tax=Agrococcus terreus TaxID=574649 RepID=A0ABQ2KF22_9MICO|nr:ABC transporter permease [Agrococcus terreus]GGN81607.1 peptide ABC transporter permease [Agrococcus terreus]